jgi:hypothetical protein
VLDDVGCVLVGIELRTHIGIIYAFYTYRNNAISAPPALPCVEVFVSGRRLRVIENSSLAHRYVTGGSTPIVALAGAGSCGTVFHTKIARAARATS